LRQLRHLVFAFALAALPATAMAFALAALPATAMAAGSSAPLGQPPLPDVHAQNPWFRYAPPNRPAVGYMVLQNTGTGAAILTGASSPDCGALTVHQSQGQNDITVPAHGSVAFVAGGDYLMCLRPTLKVGQRLPLALHFKDGSVLLLIAPVYGAASAPPGA
jgi:periplasmic copper chaperone A